MSNFNEAQKAAAGEETDPMAAFQGYSTIDGVRQEPAKPAPKAAPKADATQQDDGDDQGNNDDQGAGNDQGDQQQNVNRAKKDPQVRINKAIRAQRQAERERDALNSELTSMRERLARLEGGLTKGDDKDTVDPNAPNPDKYEFGDSDVRYIRDLARYEARKEFEAQSAQQKKATETAQQRQAREAFEAKKNEFADKGAAKFDDFDEVVLEGAANGDWPLSETVGELLFSSEYGPDIAYALASDVKEAQRVFKLSPAQQAAWFGRKEVEYSSKAQDAGDGDDDAPRQRQAPKVSQAPEPLATKVRGGGGTRPVTADTTDFAAFERMVHGHK